MVEKRSIPPSINHQKIAEQIKSKNFGDIFTISVPQGATFSQLDYQRISSLVGENRGTPKSNILPGLMSNPDFMICVNENTVTVYKDTSWNLGLFMMLQEQIVAVLKDHPDAYPSIMNKLTRRIPREERGDFGLLPLRLKDDSALVVNLDEFPLSVIKALRQLIEDPKPNLL